MIALILLQIALLTPHRLSNPSASIAIIDCHFEYSTNVPAFRVSWWDAKPTNGFIVITNARMP